MSSEIEYFSSVRVNSPSTPSDTSSTESRGTKRSSPSSSEFDSEFRDVKKLKVDSTIVSAAMSLFELYKTAELEFAKDQLLPLRSEYELEKRIATHPNLTAIKDALGEVGDMDIEAQVQRYNRKKRNVLPNNKVHYLSPDELVETEVTFKKTAASCALIWKNGVREGKVVDTIDIPGKALFVISPNLRMYVRGARSPRRDSPAFHHSSFLCGESVLFAGNLRTKPDGRMYEFDGVSGHYHPEKSHTRNAINFFQHEGVNISDLNVRESDWVGFADDVVTQADKYLATAAFRPRMSL
jgi:hypothetical protein